MNISVLPTLAIALFLTGLSQVRLLADEPRHAIDFENDLIPVFTKHGCNAGACHGSAIGRGEFKLSLYGGDPDSDFRSIAREFAGRRVNLASPIASLIVRKPSEQIEHGGGAVFDEDSESAQILIDWIKQGAKHTSLRHLESVNISPRKHVAKSVGESIRLRAIANFSDGTSRDVTAWTIFKAEDSSAVSVDLDSATCHITRRGRHIVLARYLSEVLPIEFMVPLTDEIVDLASEPKRNFIDEHVCDTLETLGLPVSPPADDATFLRRISLDLTGRLPSVVKVREFVADENANKRMALVDSLLDAPEFTEFWTLQFAKLLRIRTQGKDTQASSAYHLWLANQIRNGASFKAVASELLTATGDSHENGAANFYRTVGGPREQAEFASELFMGSRLRCANCHNHPLDRWTQDDYHGLAAIFAKIETGRIIKSKPSGEVIHPRTTEAATPKIPGESNRLDESRDGRQQLADWLTDSENPYFAKAIVNRLWKAMMGRGLVEPVDDFRATNPATHPTLLNDLAADFQKNGYRLRHTLRVIASSATYARSAATIASNQNDDRFYSHTLRRPLEPEVLADAISDVLESAEIYGGQPAGTRAVALVDPQTKSPTLDILGRCGREDSCEASSTTSGLPQKLHLFNGPLLNARISKTDSRLDRLLQAGKPPLKIVEDFYLAALNRNPTDKELKHWQSRFTSDNNPRELLEDFVWAILTCREFITNH